MNPKRLTPSLHLKAQEKMFLPWHSESGHFLVNLWPASSDTFVEREELIFPLSSLVAINNTKNIV